MDSNKKTRRLSSFHAAAYPAASPSGGVTPAPRPRASRIFTTSERRASLGIGVTPKTPRVAPAKLSREDVAQLYSETIKLSQDNKITAKNTWSLQLIDYMDMLVQKGHNGEDTPSATEEETNFQLAGVALDAGIRIYCSRVDSVHTNAFKVLGGLSRTTQGDGDGEGEDAADDGDDASVRARRRPRGGATLAPNVSSVTVRKLDTDLAVDPLFQKMSEAFDEGSVQGMLANRLLVASDGYIQFDSAEKASPPIAPPDDGTFDPGEDAATFATGDAALCPDFMRWVDGKGVAQQMASDVDVTTTQGALAPSQVAFEYDDADAVVDANHAFMPAMDADNDDDDNGAPFDDAPPDDPDDFEMAPFDVAARLSDVPRAPPPASDLMAAGVELVADSDYTFFDAGSLAAWAGPTHWTYRQKARDKKPASDKRPRSKTAMLLDYSADAPALDFSVEFKKPRRLDGAHQLADTTADERKTTLPVDLHYETNDLTRLFLLPACRVALGARNAAGPAASADDVQPYNYDNELDAQNFDEPLHFDDDDDGPGDVVFGVDEAASAYGGGDSMVPLPSRVEKLDIGYATVAKKVDVRKLKSGMWSHLCGGAEVGADAGSGVDEAPQSQDPDKDIRTHGITQSLAEVVHEMPAYLPPAELEDVTFPYVFICLLHLANEKTLRIEAVDNVLDDLVIRLDGEE